MRTVLIISAVVLLTACAGTGKKAAITTGELTEITENLHRTGFPEEAPAQGVIRLRALYIKKEFQKAGVQPFTGFRAADICRECGS
jgi:hypothetical protein